MPYDEETGLVFARARYYHPKLGRWMSRDPKGYVDGGNLYEAFRNNQPRYTDPMGTEVWAEAYRVRTTIRGVPVWRVDYTFNSNGINLGLGGLLWPSAIETEHVNTEYYRFTEDPRRLRRIDTLVEDARRLIELGVEAQGNVAAQELALEVGITGSVAAPVAVAVAPIAAGTFSTTTIGITTTTTTGNIAAASLTGGISLAYGSAASESLFGGDAGDVAFAAANGFAWGGVFGGPFGIFGRTGLTSPATSITREEFVAAVAEYESAAAPKGACGKQLLLFDDLYEGLPVLRRSASAASTAGCRSPAWTRAEVNGMRVYQRDDLINPNLTDELGRTNLQRMQEGLVPIGPDSKGINLHHMLQTADGPLAEMTRTFHQTHTKIIHINPNTIPSGINRPAFDAWRSTYWMIRANDFLPR